MTLTKWAHNEPILNGDTKGCALFQKDGYWKNSKSCADSKGFICKLEAVTSPDEHDDPGADLCDAEWVGHKGYCYYKWVLSLHLWK